MTMVAWSGRYHIDLFIVIIGVMHGDPLMYTIFNSVVEVVIPLWFKVVTVEASVLEGFV